MRLGFSLFVSSFTLPTRVVLIFLHDRLILEPWLGGVKAKGRDKKDFLLSDLFIQFVIASYDVPMCFPYETG